MPQENTDRLILAGIPPYDGEYETDIVKLIESLTVTEAHLIKDMTGVRVGEIFEALRAYDFEVVIALTLIVLRRKGKRVNAEAFSNIPVFGAITLELAERTDEDGDEDPQLEPSASEQTDSLRTSGGESSKPPSEHLQARSPSPTGPPGSETSAISVPEISAP